MRKKITSIIFLFIIIISAVILITYFNQSNTEDNQYADSSEKINDEDIENEIDEFFLDEYDEIEIGEMV
jgi:peptidoglycan hydrolase CwlO-like protein